MIPRLSPMTLPSRTKNDVTFISAALSRGASAGPPEVCTPNPLRRANSRTVASHHRGPRDRHSEHQGSREFATGVVVEDDVPRDDVDVAFEALQRTGQKVG